MNEQMLNAIVGETGLFTPEQLEEIAAALRNPESEGVIPTIVRLGLSDEESVLRAVASVLGHEYLDVSELPVDEELIQKMPARTVTQFKVVPVSFDNGQLTVATSDPFREGLEDALRLATGLDIALVYCPEEKIIRQSQKCYGVGADLLAKMDNSDIYDAELENSANKFELSGDGQEASIVKFVNQIIAEADRRAATDIHFEPMEKELRIRYRIDGLLHKVDVPPTLHRLQAAVISRIKVMANLDIAEKRMPMDGRIGIRVNGKEIDIRVSTCPVTYGESISLRLLQKGGSVVRLDQLGFGKRDDTLIRRAIHRPNGIILVTGPTGSGKSTSLYAFLHEINTIDKRILTAEEPVEYEMAGVNQVQARPDIGLTFARILRSFLRQDPDVMMVGEIRDLETAEIAINASLTGHLVFSTLHTNDAAGAFARLTDMGVEPFLISSSVELVLAQRLVRRLCPHCKKEVKPDEALLQSQNVDPSIFRDRVIHGACGCQQCGGTGYKGRGGIFEVLHVTDSIRQLVTAHRPSSEIREKAISEGMLTLREDGFRRVFDGFTTIEEVLRVTEDSDD